MKTKEEIFLDENPNVGSYNPELEREEYTREEVLRLLQKYTQSLREQLKRKEDEIDKLRVVGREWVDKIESQSELIESLAGALKIIPSEKLKQLSEYLDIVDEKRGSEGREVQDDLIKMANASSEALLQFDNFKKKRMGNNLLETLNEWYDKYREENDIDKAVFIRDHQVLAWVIKKQNSLQKENESLRKQLTWIPAEKELPQENQIVLVCGLKDTAPRFSEYKEGKFFRRVDTAQGERCYVFYYSDITHWLPIPSINNK